MSAYIVFTRTRMKDPVIFDHYAQKAREARGDHPVKPLAYYGELEVLEGDTADGVVIVEFPDRAAAKAWYHSDAYQAAKLVRDQAADYRVILVDGIA